MKAKELLIYEKLLARYGDLKWWPAKTPYEVMVGAVLTQNTAWHNVEKALANFQGHLSPQGVLDMDEDLLKELIRPAGFFNQKAVYLKELTKWFLKYDFDILKIQKQSLDALRKELLKVKGIGPETADSILLYAFDLPTFVVDAYTLRLCSRLPLLAGKTYAEVKAHFESCLPQKVEVYNHFHALIVIHGKEYCRKKPLCADCPLEKDCQKLWN